MPSPTFGLSSGSVERQDYDGLRASLAGGSLAARLYAKWLTAFLDWVERFFGDAGMADKTLFPHARLGHFRPGWHDSDGVPLALEAFPWSVT
jgi:hypothetical protein